MADPKEKADLETGAGEAMFEDMLTRPRGNPSKRKSPVDGLVLGELIEKPGPGTRVRYRIDGKNYEREAVSTVPLDKQAGERPLVLAFISGDPQQPVILGPLCSELLTAAKPANGRVALEAEEELTLRCGEASVTLTKSGKVTVRGKSLTSRAEGANRIQGGSVQIN